MAADLFTAYYRMETIEHFAKISLVARSLGRENLLSRDEVTRLQGLRGMYGISSPAPICADPAAPAGRRLPARRRAGVGGAARARHAGPAADLPADRLGTGREIRLTYGQLTALIDEAVKGVR